MSKLQEYITWKNATVFKGDVIDTLLFSHYRSMPQSTFLRQKAIKNVAREAIVMTVFGIYPELNRRLIVACLERNYRTSRLKGGYVPNANEVYLLEKIGMFVIEVFGDISQNSKRIGLDDRRIRMAEFWGFDKKYELLDDKDAIVRADDYCVSCLDIRDGSIFKAESSSKVDALLDMRDWFVFGRER